VPSAEAAVANAVAVSLPATGLALLAAWRVAWRVERGLPPLERLASTAPRLASLGRWRWPALFALGGLAGLLAAVPLGSLVWKAGSAGPVWGWPTLAASLDKAIEIRGLMVLRSIGVALAAGALAADLALVACWLATESRWLRRLTLGLAVATWVLPGPVLGIGLKETISCLLGLFPFDPLATALYHGPSYLPVLWAYALRFFPAAVALLWPVVRLLPAELRDAARVEGAGPGSEFRYVVWPLTRRAWLRAALAVAVLSLGELGASKLVETPGSVTFAHEVFAQMHFGVTSDLAALCLLLLAAAALGGGLIAVLTRSERS
jgi:iron(III) transport system permease protein